MAKQFTPSKNLETEFFNFLETHPPAQFGNDLRRLVMDYVHEALRKGIFPSPWFVSATK